MSDLPESIWADPPDIFDDMSIWYNYPTEGQTQYVRADTVQAQIDAAVAAERERWVKAIEHYFDATAVMDVEQYVDRFRKGDQP